MPRSTTPASVANEEWIDVLEDYMQSPATSEMSACRTPNKSSGCDAFVNVLESRSGVSRETWGRALPGISGFNNSCDSLDILSIPSAWSDLGRPTVSEGEPSPHFTPRLRKDSSSFGPMADTYGYGEDPSASPAPVLNLAAMAIDEADVPSRPSSAASMKPQPPVRPPSTNAFVTKAAVNARSTYILSTARAAQASQGTPEHSCQSTPRGVRIALIGGLPPTSTSMFGLKGRPLSGFKRRQQ